MTDAAAALQPVSVAPNAPAIPYQSTLAAAQQAGQNFESFFLSQAFENMYAGLGADPLFGGGSGEGVYRSLMIQEYSKVAAKSGMTGIGAEVTREISHMQETHQKA
jgi:hypothetical protein